MQEVIDSAVKELSAALTSTADMTSTGIAGSPNVEEDSNVKGNKKNKPKKAPKEKSQAQHSGGEDIAFTVSRWLSSITLVAYY